jgi:hypothetical protein
MISAVRSTDAGRPPPGEDRGDGNLVLSLRRGGDGEHVLLRLPRGPVRLARTAVLLVVAAGGLAVTAHAAVVALRDMYVFPYWDMASLQYLYFTLSWFDFLLFRDNEHLPFLAMPLYAADNLLFAARGTSLVALILALNALMAGLLIVELKRCWGRADPALAAAAGITLALFFWLIHHDNLIWPKQIHMYLSAVLSLIAGRYAAELDTRLRRDGALPARPAAALGLLLVAGTFSFGYGAIGWVAVLIVAVTGRWPRRAVATLGALFGLTILIYALRYNYATVEHHGNPVSALSDPVRLLWYTVHYLAHPVVALLDRVLDRSIAVVGGLAAALVGLIVAALFLVRVLLSRRSHATSTDIIAAFLLLFVAGTALMTGASRLRFGVDQGLTSRYAIAQILFWLALALPAAAALRERAWLRGGVVTVGGVSVLLLLVPSHFAYAATVKDIGRTHWQSVLAIVNGVRDDAQTLSNIHPSSGVLGVLNDGLAVRRWSVYADPQPHWLSRPAAELFRTEPGARCLGAFDAASDLGRLDGQSFVEGWAWDVKAGRAAMWVVLVDNAGVVRGLARSGWKRADVRAAHPQTAGAATGWRGYVAAPVPLPGVLAYAVLADGASICPLPRNVLPQSGSHGS